MASRLEAIGCSVVAVPLIEVLAPSDGGRALRSALDDLASYDWVVLTSANGVRSMTEAGVLAPWPDGVAVAAVGPATAAAAREAGMPVRLVPDVATAAALVEAFPPPGPHDGRRVLAPLAELAGDTVVAGLEARGWLVDRVEAYRTTASAEAPDALPGNEIDVGIDVVTFFSPSAVDRWVARFGTRVPVVVVCVGPSTAARAREAGLERILLAVPHSEDGVIAIVAGLTRPLR